MCGKTGAVVVALFATEKVYGDLIKGFATTSMKQQMERDTFY